MGKLNIIFFYSNFKYKNYKEGEKEC